MNLQPVRLRPGVDLRAAVQQLVASCAGGSAFLVAGIGSLTQAQLRFAGEADGTRLEGPLEITTLCGTLTPDGAHLHMTVADAQGRVWGGHVLAGCEVRTTAELLLAETPGWRMRRRHDPATGYAELCIQRGDAPPV